MSVTVLESTPRAFIVRPGYVLRCLGKIYEPGSRVLATSTHHLRDISAQHWKVEEVPFTAVKIKRHLTELEPGDKLLLERRLGGLGDVLVQTQLFPMLKDQFPHIQVDYAVPGYYQPLFEGSGVVANREWWDAEGGLGKNYHFKTNNVGMRKTILWKEYALVEDISQCCAQYETLLQWYGTYDGNRGLKLKDRLEIWAHHIGLRVQNPRTCITFRPEELAEARERFGKTNKPVLLVAPISGSDYRSYPWHETIVKEASHRWHVFYLHHEPIGPNTLTGLSVRQMGAVVAVADAIISVDTSTFHWAGLLRKPVIGIFNFLHGAETRAKYYPTAKCIQACPTPCLAHRYFRGCQHKIQHLPLSAPNGRKYSTCFQESTAAQIIHMLREWQ